MGRSNGLVGLSTVCFGIACPSDLTREGAAPVLEGNLKGTVISRSVHGL